jgi:hypothetical protein
METEDQTINDASSASTEPGEVVDVVDPQLDATASQSGERAANPDDETWNGKPFHEIPRFRELNEKARTAEERAAKLENEYGVYAPIINEFRQAGLNTGQDVLVYLQTQTEQKAAAAKRAEFDAYEADPETANLKFTAWEAQQNAQKAAHEAQQARFEAASYRMEQDLTRAQEAYPEMDAEYVKTLYVANQGKTPIDQIAKQSHDRAVASAQRAIAKYNETRAQQRASPTPEGATGAAPPKRGIPDGSDPAAFWKYMEAEGRKTEAARGG